MPDNHPIDMEHLNEVTDNDRDFQKQLFELFMETAEKCLQSLAHAANDNTKEWRERAHELKGSSANMGANALASLCKLAMEAETATHEQKHNLLTSIQAEYALVKDFFHKHIA